MSKIRVATFVVKTDKSLQVIADLLAANGVDVVARYDNSAPKTMQHEPPIDAMLRAREK